MADTETPVTVYDVVFRGLFGRNRKDKHEIPFHREVPPCFDPTPEYLTKLLDEAAAILKPKRGVMYVRKTEGCTVSTFDMGNDRTGTSLTIPLMQAVRVARRDYVDGKGVDAPLATAQGAF